MSFPHYLSPYRSNGEKRIAEYFEEREIRFSYERPIAVVDKGKTKLWYPDFHLDDYHILVEYLGMNGHARNDQINAYKKRVYRNNRIDLIEICPADFQKDWKGIMDGKIHNTLEGRLKSFTSKLPSEESEPTLQYYQQSQI